MKRTLVALILLGMFLGILSIGVFARAPREEFDFVDECDDIIIHWSTPLPTNSEDLFIIGPGQRVGNEGVPEGQYRFVGKKASTTYTRILTDVPTAYGSWTLEFSARFAELPTVASLGLAGYRGLSIAIYRSNGDAPATSYVIGFTDGVIGVVNSSEVYKKVGSSVVGKDEEFHRWRIVFDFSESTMTFFKDDKEVTEFTNVKGSTISIVTEGRIILQNVPLNLDPAGDDLDIYLDYIVFKRGTYAPIEMPSNKIYSYPNPFSDGEEVMLAYYPSKPGKVYIKMYDELGRNVFEEVISSVKAEYNEFLWNGEDDKGVSLPSGIYTCVLAMKADDSLDYFAQGIIVKK